MFSLPFLFILHSSNYDGGVEGIEKLCRQGVGRTSAANNFMGENFFFKLYPLKIFVD